MCYGHGFQLYVVRTSILNDEEDIYWTSHKKNVSIFLTYLYHVHTVQYMRCGRTCERGVLESGENMVKWVCMEPRY